MEEEIENRFQKKPKGWRNVRGNTSPEYESFRHKLAGRGIKTKNMGNARMEKARKLSAEDKLTWGEFQRLFGSRAESMLEEMINSGKIEVDADECEPDSRAWKDETRIEIDNGGELMTVSINDNTPINILE